MKSMSGNCNQTNLLAMKKLANFTLIVFLLALTSGCKKNQQIDLKPNLNVANDQILANRPFIYVFQMLVKAVADSSLEATHHAVIDNATVSLDAKHQKYSFSFQGNLCADSVIRFGTFVATVDSGFFHKGTVINITFPGYIEDFHRITGNDSILSEGLVNGEYRYENFITGAEITKDSIHTIQFGAVYQISVSLSVLALGANQTVITFNGSSSGISSAAYPFTAEITKSLSLYEICPPWIIDGLIAFSISGVEVKAGTIEFMSKTSCSDKIKYDFEGNIYYLRMNEQYLGH